MQICEKRYRPPKCCVPFSTCCWTLSLGPSITRDELSLYFKRCRIRNCRGSDPGVFCIENLFMQKFVRLRVIPDFIDLAESKQCIVPVAASNRFPIKQNSVPGAGSSLASLVSCLRTAVSC